MSSSTNETDSDDTCDPPFSPMIAKIFLMTLFVLLAESCITIIINRTKKLRGKSSTILVTSIAVSKLLIAVLYGTYSVLYTLYHDSCIDKHTEKVLVYVGLILPRIFHLVSVFSLCSVTLDRYVAICWPLHYHNILTPFRVKALTIASWCFPALVFMVHRVMRHLNLKYDISIPGVIYVVLFWPPTLAILVMYCLLAKEFRGKTAGRMEMKEEDDRVRYRTTRDVIVVVMINIVLCFPHVSSSAVEYTYPSPKSYYLFCSCHSICQYIKSHEFSLCLLAW